MNEYENFSQNPWQSAMAPWGSPDPTLRITGLKKHFYDTKIENERSNFLIKDIMTCLLTAYWLQLKI